ncbi:peptidoglycan-binding domain-containing protein [Anaerosolibacter sp.]|uniref:peptidoglycan-binding domain-containing protein n=1 Tax=Anaerosolibacter sp. TaxID=1872527 RepID=UPI0039EE6EE0
MKKAIALAVCASFMFSSVALAADSVTLKQGNVDVVAAATAWTPAPAPAPKPAAPKAPATAPVKADGTLKLGSKGTAVKDLQTKLNANGYKLVVDGIFGKLTLAAVKDYQTKNGLTADGIVGAAMMEKLNAPVATPVASSTVTLKVGRVQDAPHGTKSFADTVVVLAGDKIVATSIDEYQFLAKATAKGVPNSDSDFGKNYADPANVLASKMTNAASYSENMKTKAGSTVTLDKNFAAIQAFAKGKTVAELEAILAKNTKEQMVDVVSGATLADTHGYLSSIVAAAKAAKENGSIDVAAANNLKVGRVEAAPHGTKTFGVAVVVMDGNKIVAASIDEYQFMAKETSIGVPNSDSDFGKNYKDPAMVLGSKRANTATYSANMAKKAGSVVAIDKNFDIIEDYAEGKTVAVLEGSLVANTPEKMVDVVSGATLADTHGYLTSILAAAKVALGAEAVDVVTTASLVNTAAAFEKGISKNGRWIVSTLNDITTTKTLVLDGEFKNGKKDAEGKDLIQRKIALYTQDDKRNVTARFTLTAPKLVIKSPNASLEKGTFKGDLYVRVPNFKLVDQKVEGNVYFTTKEAQDTFAPDATSVITGKQLLTEIDTTTSASLVDNMDAFEKGISKEGTWIVSVLNDLTTDKELVLDGEFKNDDKLDRKIALYNQVNIEGKRSTLERYTLTAPKLTINSPAARLQGGTFKGDLYVNVPNFRLLDAKVDGNIYFATEEAKATFSPDATSVVTGKQEVKAN